jgi:hypothetical protein
MERGKGIFALWWQRSRRNRFLYATALPSPIIGQGFEILLYSPVAAQAVSPLSGEVRIIPSLSARGKLHYCTCCLCCYEFLSHTRFPRPATVLRLTRSWTSTKSRPISGVALSDDPQYIVQLIEKVITVSLETIKIVKGLPG